MKNIQKKLIINLSIAMLISVATPVVMYGMNRPRQEGNQEFHEEFKSLLPEVQQKIQNLMLQDAIAFLATKPIILNGISKIKISDNKIVTVSSDDSAKIWSIDERQLKLLHTITGLDGNPARVTSIAIQDNNVAIGSLNDSAKIWHIDNGQVQLLHTLTAPNTSTENATAVAISNNKVAIESQFPRVNRTGITIWDITTGAQLKALRFLDANGGVFLQDLATGNDRLVTFLTDGTTIMWDMNTGKATRVDPQAISAISGDRAIAIADGRVRIWDTNTGKIVKAIKINTTGNPNEPTIIPILDAAISGDKVCMSLEDGTIKVWQINGDLQLGSLFTRNNQRLTSLAVSDNAVVGIDEQNQTAKIWPLSPNLQGTPQNNPLIWIIENATMLQANLIKQAYEATIAGQEFILDRADLQTFSGLPMHVKQYLLNRLTIRR